MTTWLGYLVNWFSGMNRTAILILWVIDLVVALFVSFLTRGGPTTRGGSRRRPTLAFAVSLVAGMLIMVDGFAITASRVFDFEAHTPSDLLAIFAALGYAQSFVVWAAAATLLIMPNRHAFWGSVIIFFAFASALVGGGFILGSILGSIGGVLAVNWEPSSSSINQSVLTKGQAPTSTQLPDPESVQTADQGRSSKEPPP